MTSERSESVQQQTEEFAASSGNFVDFVKGRNYVLNERTQRQLQEIADRSQLTIRPHDETVEKMKKAVEKMNEIMKDTNRRIDEEINNIIQEVHQIHQLLGMQSKLDTDEVKKPEEAKSSEPSKTDKAPAEPEPVAPVGTKEEEPDVTTARENFRNTVSEFLAKLKKLDDSLPDDMKVFSDKNFQSSIANLRKFAAGGQLALTNNEIIEQMQLLSAAYERKKILYQERLGAHAVNKDQISQEKGELDGIIKKAEGEESKYQKAVKKESAAPNGISPSFVNHDGHRLLVAGGGVQATNTSMPSFKAALAEFKGPNNERAFTNVRLIAPPVNAELANKSPAYLEDVVKRLEATLKAGLNPEADIATITGVLSQEMNLTPIPRSIERSRNQAMIDRLDRAIVQYKDAEAKFKAGQKPETPQTNAEAAVQRPAPKPADPASTDQATLTVSPKPVRPGG